MENIVVKYILFEKEVRKNTSIEFRFVRVMERDKNSLTTIAHRNYLT